MMLIMSSAFWLVLIMWKYPKAAPSECVCLPIHFLIGNAVHSFKQYVCLKLEEYRLHGKRKFLLFAHALFLLVNTGSSNLSCMFSFCRSHKSVALAPFSPGPDILFLPDALQRLSRMCAVRSWCRFGGCKAARAYYYHLWIILILLLGPPVDLAAVCFGVCDIKCLGQCTEIAVCLWRTREWY